MRNLLIGFISIILLLTALVGFSYANNDHQCNANNPQNCPNPTVICGNGEHTGNPHCITPTVEITASPTPECDECNVTPTASPSATPTVEPTTPPVGNGDGLSDGKSDGRSDGRSSAPQPTLYPEVGFK